MVLRLAATQLWFLPDKKHRLAHGRQTGDKI
jgi:hypothetical protein